VGSRIAVAIAVALMTAMAPARARAADECSALFGARSPALSGGRCDLLAAIDELEQRMPAPCVEAAQKGRAEESIAALGRIAHEPASAVCPEDRATLAMFALCRLQPASLLGDLLPRVTVLAESDYPSRAHLRLVRACVGGWLGVEGEREGDGATARRAIASVAERLADRPSSVVAEVVEGAPAAVREALGATLDGFDFARVDSERVLRDFCPGDGGDETTAPARLREACRRARERFATVRRASERARRHTLGLRLGLTAATLALTVTETVLGIVFRNDTIAPLFSTLAGGTGGALAGAAIALAFGRWRPVATLVLTPIFGVAGAAAGYFLGTGGKVEERVVSTIGFSVVGLACGLTLVWTY
jgi:hypothetical protein